MEGNSTKANGPNHLYKVIYIGITFMVLFSAYSIAKNLITYIYKDMGFTYLGRICIFSLYVIFFIGNIFAPYFERKFSTKAGLIAGSLTYVGFVVAGTLTAYCYREDLHTFVCSDVSIYLYNIVLSGVIGFGAATLWLTQSNYVNDCTNSTNKGTYHGLFTSIMQLSMLIGSTMAAFVLRYADWFTFYFVLSCLSIIATIMFVFLPHLEAKQDRLQKVQKSAVDSMKEFFYCYQERRYLSIFIASFTSGFIVSFQATYLPTVVEATVITENTNIISQRISIAFISMGLGQTLAGYSVGRLVDRFPKLKISDYIFGNVELAFILSFLAMQIQSYFFAIIAGFLWGTCDNGIKTVIISLISKKFDGKPELFATYRATQSFGIIVGSLCALIFADFLGSFFVVMMLGLQVSFHVTFNILSPKDVNPELEIELIEKNLSMK